jgi:hypothetical protein
VPQEGWAQIIIFASALELLAPQREGRVAGNVQPDTDVFPVPGEAVMQTRELNNGRLAMISILGIFAGENLTGGQDPVSVSHTQKTPESAREIPICVAPLGLGWLLTTLFCHVCCLAFYRPSRTGSRPSPKRPLVLKLRAPPHLWPPHGTRPYVRCVSR